MASHTIPNSAPDFYAILGVSEAATTDQIKSAYRRQALRFHPDKNPGNPVLWSRFKGIREAYEMLSDPLRKEKYDLLRARRRPEPEVDRKAPLSQNGRASRSPRSAPWSGHEPLEIVIGAEEAQRGCMRCVLHRGRPLNLEIPARCSDLQVLRFRINNGDAFALPEYLFFRVHIQKEIRFERQGRDLGCYIQLDPHMALLGGERTIRVPNGKVLRVRIAPGTVEGTILCAKGMGLAAHQPNPAGDLLIRIRIRFPRELRPGESDLWRLVLRMKAARIP